MRYKISGWGQGSTHAAAGALAAIARAGAVAAGALATFRS